MSAGKDDHSDETILQAEIIGIMVHRDFRDISVRHDREDIVFRGCRPGNADRPIVFNRAAILEAFAEGRHVELIEEMVA